MIDKYINCLFNLCHVSFQFIIIRCKKHVIQALEAHNPSKKELEGGKS